MLKGLLFGCRNGKVEENWRGNYYYLYYCSTMHRLFNVWLSCLTSFAETRVIRWNKRCLNSSPCFTGPYIRLLKVHVIAPIVQDPVTRTESFTTIKRKEDCFSGDLFVHLDCADIWTSLERDWKALLWRQVLMQLLILQLMIIPPVLGLKLLENQLGHASFFKGSDTSRCRT